MAEGGRLAPNGVYVARLTGGGSVKEAAFSVEHAVAGLGRVDFLVNPARGAAAAIGLSLKPGVSASAQLYGASGERVGPRRALAARDSLPLSSEGGQPVADGLYLVVLDFSDGQGRSEQIIVKLAVLR
jgi:hypothetical protein